MPLTSGLKGQRVLVTAASRGIGFAAARAFVEEGARVVLNGSNQTRLDAAVKDLRSLGDVQGVVADLTQHSELDRLVADTRTLLGGIDTLVYNTGSPAPGTFMEQSFETWQAAANLLTVSPAYLAQRVADLMLTSHTRGRMVFSASIAIREPIPTIATSNVCRIAIAGLVRTLARELGPNGIRVNGVLPGYIATERVDHVFEDAARRRGTTSDQVRSALTREIPLGRIGSPEELARAFIFLGSDMSSYVTGALLPVDGGFLRSVG
ncbi:MAG: SDR family oxidoreductase [Thermoplasmata archaeon]|nr:SDR family oxidoreductase [Thermoplasmata archaeon]